MNGTETYVHPQCTTIATQRIHTKFSPRDAILVVRRPIISLATQNAR